MHSLHNKYLKLKNKTKYCTTSIYACCAIFKIKFINLSNINLSFSKFHITPDIAKDLANRNKVDVTKSLTNKTELYSITCNIFKLRNYKDKEKHFSNKEFINLHYFFSSY